MTISAGFKTDFAYRTNKQIYFDPSETVGLGSTAGVGIGSTIFFSNPGAGATLINIPTKTLFFKDHEFETGDLVTYSSGIGSGIVVQDETNVGVGTTLASGTQLFIAKVSNNLIGLSTVRGRIRNYWHIRWSRNHHHLYYLSFPWYWNWSST